MDDRDYMRIAIELAEKGKGWTAPNPMVGAVIVRAGRIIGQGWHERYGELHAERNALKNCTEDPKGAEMYVTLEPCCHYGKQPPCTDAIIRAGISRVITGSSDPNPLVNGRGISILREHGIEVRENVMKEECDRINYVFFHYIRTGLPYVVMKYAMTMDGKTAAYTGASKWITGEQAREHVGRQRGYYTAIMAGVGTILADDPLLTCRVGGGKNPIRIICDTHLRTPLKSKIVKTAMEIPTIIAAGQTKKEQRKKYEDMGCTVLRVDEKDGSIDLKHLMELLGKRNVDSVLVEGGGTLNWSVLGSGLANRVMAYVAPSLLGGSRSKTPVEGLGFPAPDNAVQLKNCSITGLGRDFLIEGETYYGTGQKIWKGDED